MQHLPKPRSVKANIKVCRNIPTPRASGGPRSRCIQNDANQRRAEELEVAHDGNPLRGTQRDDLLSGLRVTGFERRVTIAFIVTAAGYEKTRSTEHWL